MDEPIQYQTRSETNGLLHFDTLAKAFQVAEADPTIWKISFSLPNGERVRLVRYADPKWIYQDIHGEG